MIRAILMAWPIDCALSRFQWYRRYVGGRWEYHWIDICASSMWLSMAPGKYWPEYRQPCSHGTPVIEDWPRK